MNWSEADIERAGGLLPRHLKPFAKTADLVDYAKTAALAPLATKAEVQALAQAVSAAYADVARTGDLAGLLRLADLDPYLKIADQPIKFVQLAPLTRAQLKATYPANASRVGMYARVSDLWGVVSSVVVCESNGTSYYWRPQRTDFAVTTAQNTGPMTLTPMLTAPEVVMTASLIGGVDLALSTTDVWPGCRFRVWAPSALNLNNLRFTGLIGGAVKALLGGGVYDAVYTADGWKA